MIERRAKVIVLIPDGCTEECKYTGGENCLSWMRIGDSRDEILWLMEKIFEEDDILAEKQACCLGCIGNLYVQTMAFQKRVWVDAYWNPKKRERRKGVKMSQARGAS